MCRFIVTNSQNKTREPLEYGFPCFIKNTL